MMFKKNKSQSGAFCVKNQRKTNFTDINQDSEGKVTRVLSRARRQCRGCFYRLTECHPLEEDGGMACVSCSRRKTKQKKNIFPREGR